MQLFLYVGILYIIDDWKEDNVNSAKQGAIVTAYSSNDSTTITDDDGNVINRIVIKPNDSKTGYQISYNDDADNLKKIKEKFEKQTGKSASKFSNFELAVFGALMDNGADLDYYTEEQLHCFPAFIKAEASTQYLDLRSNKQKNTEKSSKDYEPRQLKDLKENEVPGIILVQRTNTNSNAPYTLEYKIKSDFDALVSSNNKDAINYFTVDEDGNLVIAKWNHTVVTVNGTYPKNLDDSEKETSKDEYTITTEKIAYSEYVKKYTMPFEFLVQLLVITEEPDFCKELVDHVLDGKIVINIQEEETFTETDETRKYIVHTKDKKYIDYDVKAVGQDIENKSNYFLKYDTDDEKKDCTNYSDPPSKTTVTIHTETTRHSYALGISEADVWFEHYEEIYTKQPKDEQKNTNDPPLVSGKYKKIEDKTTTNSGEITKDKDVQKFINESVSNYTPKIIIPDVKIISGSDNDGNYKEIKINNRQYISDIRLFEENKKYREILDNKGKGTGKYLLPGQILIVTQKVGSTDKTAEIPKLMYEYDLNTDETEYILRNNINPLVNCTVSKLRTENFEKIDLDSYIETAITKYPADPNPTTKTHIYATKSEKPGKGHGDENIEYEKFLVAYDNNGNARNQINSIESWLFEMMEKRDGTVELVKVIKYLLYMYDGRSRGVTELDLDIYKPSEFKSVSYGRSALSEYLKSWENNALRQYINGEITDYNSSIYINQCITQDKKNYIMCDDIGTGNGNRNFGFGICFYVGRYSSFQNIGYFADEGIDITAAQYQNYGVSTLPVEIVDRIKERIIEDKRNEVKRIASGKGLSLEEYQIDALAACRYQGWYIEDFLDAYKQYGLDARIRSYCSGMNSNCMPAARGDANWELFSTGKYKDPSGNEIIVRGNGGSILECAKDIHKYMEQNKYEYCVLNIVDCEHVTNNCGLNTTFEESKTGYHNTCCATFVSWVLRDAGYIDETIHGADTLASTLESKYNFTKVSKDNLEAGDIMVYNGHIQIYAGNGQIYNAGSIDSIQRANPYTSNWEPLYGLRAPN